MSFDLTNSQHKNVAQTLGLYFGGFITAAFVAGGLYTDGYKYACAFAVGGVFYFLVTLVMYAVTIPELLNIANGQTAPQSPQIEPDEAIDDDEEIHPPQPQRPLQAPVREAQFVTQAEPMRLSTRALGMIVGDSRFPYPQKWLHDLADARLNGDLIDGVSDRQLSIAIGIDRVNEAPQLKTWLIERQFLTEDSKNWIHAWTPRGCIAFPVGK